MNIDEIKFTDNAANKVLELIADENNLSLGLRVAIAGGGCSGFQYSFLFDDNISEDDYVVTTNAVYQEQQQQVNLLVDPISFSYLQGAVVDYQQDLQGEQFIVSNPNASTTCGCGNSFDI